MTLSNERLQALERVAKYATSRDIMQSVAWPGDEMLEIVNELAANRPDYQHVDENGEWPQGVVKPPDVAPATKEENAPPAG